MVQDVKPKCPSCGSVIYSKRNLLCGVCGKRLPADLLLSGAERERVERDLNEAKSRLARATRERRARDMQY